MHLSIVLTVFLASLLNTASAAAVNHSPKADKSWAKINSFFLHAFPKCVLCLPRWKTPCKPWFLLTLPCRTDRVQLLDGIQAADLKVVRLFISETFADFQSTGSVYMPDIEPEHVGVYDDTQLEAIDQLMAEAHERGILNHAKQLVKIAANLNRF